LGREAVMREAVAELVDDPAEHHRAEREQARRGLRPPDLLVEVTELPGDDVVVREVRRLVRSAVRGGRSEPAFQVKVEGLFGVAVEGVGRLDGHDTADGDPGQNRPPLGRPRPWLRTKTPVVAARRVGLGNSLREGTLLREGRLLDVTRATFVEADGEQPVLAARSRGEHSLDAGE